MDISALASLKEQLPILNEEIDRTIAYMATKTAPFKITPEQLAEAINTTDGRALVMLSVCHDLKLVAKVLHEFYCFDHLTEPPITTLEDVKGIQRWQVWCPFHDKTHALLKGCAHELYFVFNP